MLWFARDGSITGSARHLVSYYELVLRGQVERIWTPVRSASIRAWRAYSPAIGR